MQGERAKSEPGMGGKREVQGWELNPHCICVLDMVPLSAVVTGNGENQAVGAGLSDRGGQDGAREVPLHSGGTQSSFEGCWGDRGGVLAALRHERGTPSRTGARAGDVFVLQAGSEPALASPAPPARPPSRRTSRLGGISPEWM